MDNTCNFNIRDKTRTISLCELQKDAHLKPSCDLLVDKTDDQIDIEGRETSSKRTSVPCILSQDMFIDSDEQMAVSNDKTIIVTESDENSRVKDNTGLTPPDMSFPRKNFKSSDIASSCHKGNAALGSVDNTKESCDPQNVSCEISLDTALNSKNEIPVIPQDKSKLGLMSLNATKAGMHGLDTERINAIIDQASKGSKFYEAKAKTQKRIDSQVENMDQEVRKLLPANISLAEREADRILNVEQINVEQGRTIVHVDMDAFYAAVHERDDPSLKTKPMAVGSMGMLSTSNYLARRFGVRAGMPGFIGKKLCPNLCIIPTDFEKYRKIAAVTREIFAEYDPNFVAMSLDEAYLDITEYLKCRKTLSEDESQSKIKQQYYATESFIENDGVTILGDKIISETIVEKVVKEIRHKIQSATNGLTASAGIAPNTVLAKICSDFNKPNGQYVLTGEREIYDFVKKLPIRKVSGIGNVSEQILTKVLNIRTCGDLYEKRGMILLLFKPATAHFLLRISLGIGESMLSSKESPRKSMSSETTFEDTSAPQKLFQICDELCLDLAKSLCKTENSALHGKQVTVKIKTYKFEIKTKVTTLCTPTSEYETISSAARKVLKQLMDTAVEKPLKLRLIGVRISGFEEEMDKSTESNQPSIHQFLKNKILTEDTDCVKAPNNLPEKSNAPTKTAKDVIGVYPLSVFTCPICNLKVRTQSENTFNAHLDSCLKISTSQSAHTEVLQENVIDNTDIQKVKKYNLEYFHDFCAKYHEKEKENNDRKRNLNAFHNMVARNSEMTYKRQKNCKNSLNDEIGTIQFGYSIVFTNLFFLPLPNK